MDFAQIFKAFVTCSTALNHHKSTEARESNQMNLNARDILVVHIGVRFLIISYLTSEGGGQKYIFEKCLVLGDFFF